MEHSIAQRLVARREALNLSRKSLGDLVETSETQIWRYETGKNDPTTQMLLKLCDALRCSADWLMGLSNEQEVVNPKRWQRVATIPLPGGRKIDIGHRIEKLDDLEAEAVEILRSKSLSRREEIMEILRHL